MITELQQSSMPILDDGGPTHGVQLLGHELRDLRKISTGG